MASRFMTIQFLYQTIIGRALIKLLNGDNNDYIDDNNGDGDGDPTKNNCCIIEKALKNDSKINNLLQKNDPILFDYIQSIPNAIRFNGILLQGYLVFPKVLKKIENLPINFDDVWLCTYPKSGTTWTEEILSLIYTDGNLEQTSKKLLAKRVPHLEVGKPFGHLKWIKSIESPRLMATHLNANSIPKQLRQGKAKIIYVLRNPKDNAVSYYHHHRMSSFLGNYSGSWDDFIQLYAKGQLVYGDWFEHLHGFYELKQKNPEQILFISYEEMKIDLNKMIGLISKFVGRNLSQDRIDRIAELCTFEKMKNNSMVNREKLPITDLYDMNRSKFMRKGIIGDWKNNFSDEQSKLFDKTFNLKLKSIGMEMVYDYEQAKKIMNEQGRIIKI